VAATSSSSRRNSETLAAAAAAPGDWIASRGQRAPMRDAVRDALRVQHTPTEQTSTHQQTSMHQNNHPLSHTGNPVQAPKHGLRSLGPFDHEHSRLLWKAGAQSSLFQHKVKASLRASGRQVVRSSGPAKQNTMRSFPRSYNRTHISKWLIAENSGKCLEELDVLVGKQSILSLV
jgi:hypothetical protein